MSRRNKLIVIVATIVSFCVVAAIVYDLGYGTIRVLRDLRRMEARRQVLLYHTDHQVLLEACRELSIQMAAGKPKIDHYRLYKLYGDPDPETQLFPQPILALKPFQVYVDNNGVDLIMSPTMMYGVRAYFDGLTHGDIELVPGLWYYDEDFRAHPEHKKQVEELLKERKAHQILSLK